MIQRTFIRYWVSFAVCMTSVALRMPTADAQTFSPVSCNVCPSYTEVPWTFDSSELPTDPNCSAGTCPHYINNINQWRSVIANKWVKEFQFRIDSFDTEPSFDYIDYGEVSGSLTRLTGSPVLGWRGVVSSKSIQERPIDFLFHTDSNVARPGFAMGKARVCCSFTAPLLDVVPQRALVPLERTTGVLLGNGDTIYGTIPIAPNNGKQSIALWGPSNADFDVYVRCNALPTVSVWDYRAYSADSQEVLILPRPGACTYPGTWYVAISSYSGAGQFNIVTSPMFDSGVVSLRVGFNFNASATQLTNAATALSKTSRQFYGQTEGQILIKSYDIWNDTGSSCSNCGGQICDVCFEDEPGTGWCCSGNQVTVQRNYFSDPEGIAHEFGHRFLGVSDEYEGSGGVWKCGHSNMAKPWGDQNNFCVEMDHNKDSTPGSTPSPNSSVWKIAYTSSKLPIGLGDTGDNYDYMNHDFNGMIQTIQH